MERVVGNYQWLFILLSGRPDNEIVWKLEQDTQTDQAGMNTQVESRIVSSTEILVLCTKYAVHHSWIWWEHFKKQRKNIEKTLTGKTPKTVESKTDGKADYCLYWNEIEGGEIFIFDTELLKKTLLVWFIKISIIFEFWKIESLSKQT